MGLEIEWRRKQPYASVVSMTGVTAAVAGPGISPRVFAARDRPSGPGKAVPGGGARVMMGGNSTSPGEPSP
jgi:hypothetical protein